MNQPPTHAKKVSPRYAKQFTERKYIPGRFRAIWIAWLLFESVLIRSLWNHLFEFIQKNRVSDQ